MLKRPNIQIRKANSTSLINYIVLLLFTIQFPIIPGVLNSRRMAALYALAYILTNWGKIRNYYRGTGKYFLLFSLGMLVCAVINFWNRVHYHISSQNEYYVWHNYISLILYIAIFPIYASAVFKDIKKISEFYINFMIFQTFIVVIELFNYSFRIFFYNYFYADDGRFAQTIENGSRVVGFFMSASAGSLYYCAAAILLLNLYYIKRICTKEFLIKYMLIILGTAFMGRTGFYLEILMLLYFFITDRKNFVLYVLAGIVALCLISIALRQIGGDVADYYIRWMGQVINPETRFATISIIEKSPVPKFSPEMILGTNIHLGITPSGSIMASDSGYAKSYTSIGVIGSFFFYSSFFVLLVKLVRGTIHKQRFFYYLCVGILFVVEWKEPFFFKLVLVWQVVMMLLLSQKWKTDQECGITDLGA